MAEYDEKDYSLPYALENIDINSYFLNCNVDILAGGIMGAK